VVLERLAHERIAVQWDVAVEFGALEGAMGPKLPLDQIVPGLARCIERVPAGVPVGMHLCYGDYGHQHFMQPGSLQMQVDVVNAVTSAARRPLNFVSFTVPQGRNDSAYFEPLRELRTGADTELYFALVPYHPDDQTEGTTAEQIEHIDAALFNSPGGARHWGICTECGMGRVDAGDVPRLLELHHQILAAARA
jgi:methionine synthase II (cobalamin-independent)